MAVHAPGLAREQAKTASLRGVAYATGECRSKVQRAITRKTVAARRKGEKRKILLDHLIERAEGRRVPRERLEAVKAQIAQTLCEALTKAQ
ncbi:MAG: hypothetical protein M3463_00610 [Verrucomicrobiota bacterium]|nr:hypothetical protein [Verrucomicrobiota bacterium]